MSLWMKESDNNVKCKCTKALLQHQRFILNTLLLLPVHSKDQYQLHLGEYTGNAGNALADIQAPPSAWQKWAGPGLESNRGKFSTYDQLNDGDAENNDTRCIRHSKSGWWFSRYFNFNLTVALQLCTN